MLMMNVFSWVVAFVLCVLEIRVQALEKPLSFNLDFSPFTKAIEIAVKKSAQIPDLASNSTNTDCVMPKSSIMFTYANHYMMELIVLQHQAMEVWDLKTCLESRFIIMCLDVQCLESCTSNHFENCILLASENVLPASDHGKEAYYYFTFLKHHFMYHALKVVDEVFFFDADVVLFRNPWIATRKVKGYDQMSVAEKKVSDYDLMYQRESGFGSNCGGTANTGQVYIRNSPRIQKYFEELFSHKDEIMAGKGLDQDYVPGAAKYAELFTCAFPVTEFVSHCHIGRRKFIDQNTRIKEFVSYHPACVQGMSAKKERAQLVIDGIREKNKKHTVGNYICSRKQCSTDPFLTRLFNM